MQHSVAPCQHDVCVQWAGEQQESVQLCPILSLLRAGGDAVSLALVLCSLCLRHQVSSKNGLELPFFHPDCSEVSPNKVQLVLEIVFRWWVCLKRKMMVLHLLLAVMMALRFQHFSLNYCISVILFLWLAGVFGLRWEFWLCGKRANDKSGWRWLPAILHSYLGVVGSKKRLAVPYQGLPCLLVWDAQPEQTRFLIRLSAGHLSS